MAQARAGPADSPTVCRQLLFGVIPFLLAVISLGIAATPDSGSPSDLGATASYGDTVNGLTSRTFAGLSMAPGVAGQSWTLAKSVFPGYTIRRTVPEVRLQFTVADEHGQLVTNLSATDLRIFDNQSKVTWIRQFSRLEDLPLDVGILVDVSDSVRKNIEREKMATHIFLRQVLRPQTDRAFLMGFGREVKLWQASTGDPIALNQAVERIQQAGYTTNLYDGLFSACADQFPQTGHRQGLTQRIIVLFSDGADTASLHGMPDVIAQAQRNEIQIFALSVHAIRKSQMGDEVLQRLADQTGGRFYVASSGEDLPAIFAEMEQQMRTQYSVSFQPQQQTPGFHLLRLEVYGFRNLRVRARQGYYFDDP